MPSEQTIEKAKLRELDSAGEGIGDEIPVQFNPQTLKLNFSNQQAGNGQPGGSATQFTGLGVTKLSLELFFDVTAPAPIVQTEADVRKLTMKVARFIMPTAANGNGENTGPTPPTVRFSWGSFLFDGVMESMDETLEFFSKDGIPLRATVSISLTKKNLAYDFDKSKSPAAPGAAAAGTQPNEPARKGDSVQQMAARNGNQGDWKEIARANDIENPRGLAPGTLVNMNPHPK